MRLLLDANALLWAVEQPERLAPSARAAIADASNSVLVSAASLWELAIKHGLGRLRLPEEFHSRLEERGFDMLSITPEHAWVAGALPLHHGDPFDRMLVAQAQLEGLTIVTRDAKIARYQVAVLPA